MSAAFEDLGEDLAGSHGPPWESLSRVLLAPVCITTLERGNESKNRKPAN